VTVTATGVGTGRAFVDVTNARGEYRLVGMQAGKYKVQAELAGFAQSVLPEVELLVGQNATITFTMKVATVEETLTVSATSPLVDTRQAQVSGNVDRRQMEELPVNGRNWLQLSTMVKGITANQITDTSTPNGSTRTAAFRVNLDGQEITQRRRCRLQPAGISRDAIADAQIVTNMFDITMGRSVGIRSGDFKAGRIPTRRTVLPQRQAQCGRAYTGKVLPYSNQQVGGTFGGPSSGTSCTISSRTRIAARADIDRHRTGAVRGETITLPTDTYQHYAGRGDYQLTNKDHLLIRGSFFNWQNPHFVGATTSPTGAGGSTTRIFLTDWSRVMRNNLLQELRSAGSIPVHQRPRRRTAGPEPSSRPDHRAQLELPQDWNRDPRDDLRSEMAQGRARHQDRQRAEDRERRVVAGAAAQ
jgi:hypothetical protein